MHLCEKPHFQVEKCWFVLVNHCGSELMQFSVDVTGQFFLRACGCGLGWWHSDRSRHPPSEAVFSSSASGEVEATTCCLQLACIHLVGIYSSSTQSPQILQSLAAWAVSLWVLLLTWPRSEPWQSFRKRLLGKQKVWNGWTVSEKRVVFHNMWCWKKLLFLTGTHKHLNVLSEQPVFSYRASPQAPFLPWGAKIKLLGLKVTVRWTCLLLSEMCLHSYGSGSSA